MHIDTLKLTHFRNYSKRSFSFKETTAFVGKNGVGKTNILEAIRYLSVMKSFRAKREREVIMFGHEVARVVGKGIVGDEVTEVAVGLAPDRKQVTVNGVKKRVSQAVGVFKTVLFAPDDLDFVTGAPTLRRRFMDTIIGQKNIAYLTALLDVQRIVRNRNALLVRIQRGEAQRNELDFWNETLIAVATIIQPAREKLIGELNNDITRYYQAMSGDKKSELIITYVPSVIDKEEIAKSLARDIRYGATTLGPHHDDLSLTLDGELLSAYGSRGERRTAVLSLKQAEVAVLTDPEPPILLLDDILSELDAKRQDHLSSLFGAQQTIITATELSPTLRQASEEVVELK